MATATQIEWTDATWNPVTGCTKITAGCDNCYAARFSARFRGVPGHPFENGFDLTLRPDRVAQPLLWRRRRMIFVNSMSDLFQKGVPQNFIDSVFSTMETADWHVFQLLTKRSSLMRDYLKPRYRDNPPPAHIWVGVSLENAKARSRQELTYFERLRKKRWSYKSKSVATKSKPNEAAHRRKCSVLR